MHDVIVVGGGAAGVAAALQFAQEGIVPLMLDVGVSEKGSGPRVEGNLYDYREREDSFELFIGKRFEGLANLLESRTLPVKLTTPNSTWITEHAERLAPVHESGFNVVQSFARGGLANAWGAGLYPFVDHDLSAFPIRAADLEPYFVRLTAEIGISGTDDDLTPYFGPTTGLTRPLRLSRNMATLYRRYRNRRRSFATRGIAVGHPRLGVASEGSDGRPAFMYTNTEFWQQSTAIYSPGSTLERLAAGGRLRYAQDVLVRSWSEDESGIHVTATHAETGEPLQFDGKSLVLAAGAVNTTKIVLQAFADTTTELELLENPALQIPLILPGAIGRPLDVEAFGLVQLNLVWDIPATSTRLQGSIMELTSPMRAEFFGGLPYAARDNLSLLRYLLPGMIVMQLFFPGRCGGVSRVSLGHDGRLRIVGPGAPSTLQHIPELLAALRRLGAFTHRSFVVRVPMGNAIHYAGTLPMRAEPGPFECNADGLLHGTRAVYVADSATFSDLPAKNMSFAMMANAMRVARGVAVRTLGRQ